MEGGGGGSLFGLMEGYGSLCTVRGFFGFKSCVWV